MIFTALFSVIWALVYVILAVLPDFTGLPSAIQTSFTWAFTQTSSLAGFVPVGTAYIIFGLWAVTELVVLAFKFLAWVFHWKQGAA